MLACCVSFGVVCVSSLWFRFSRVLICLFAFACCLVVVLVGIGCWLLAFVFAASLTVFCLI